MTIARLMQMAAAGNIREGWDLANAVFNGGPYGQLSVAAQETSPQGLFFKPDGLKMYVVGSANDAVHQYSTGSTAVNTITWSDNIQWAGGTAPSIDYNYSTDVLINFTTYDGNNWIGTQLSLDSRSS
jgi:hypothetical protein